MVTLLVDLHFWTFREDIVIKDADIGVYRYQEKGTVNKERVYYPQRKDYIEARGGTIILRNTRPTRLRDSLKELEEILTKERIVWQGWTCFNKYQLFFASGTIAVITVNNSTGDISSVIFDKYLQGKLLSENVVDGVFTSRYLIFTYNDNRATLINLTKKSQDESKFDLRLSSIEPKVSTCHGIGPAGRRFERKISLNSTEEMVCFWWKTGEDEVFPWTPVNKESDRANILVYAISGSNLELLCFCRTEMSPLNVKFSNARPDTILTVEQSFDQKGGVTVLSCVYEIRKRSLYRTSVISIPLEAPLTAHSRNPSETRLLLACNNGVLALHCESRGMTHVTKAGLIPSCIAWLESGCLLFIGNDRGQMQCFDMALSLVRMQILFDSFNPQRILDFSEYFCHQPLLERIAWGPLPKKDNEGPNCPSIPLLMLQFTNGPFACLRIGTAECPFQTNFKDPSSSVHPISSPYSLNLSSSLLISLYVKNKQFDEAVNLLVSLNWELEGSLALQSLSTIVSALLMLPLNAHREGQLEAALGSFLVPAVALSQSVQDEFGPPVRAMTRRFFYRVLRQGRLEKAYRLSLDLKDHDCFLAVHRVARNHGNTQLASLALENAREIAAESHWCEFCGSHCHSGESASHSSCSTCSSDSEEEQPKSATSDFQPLRRESIHMQVPKGAEQNANGFTNMRESRQLSPQASSAIAPPFQSDGVITINIKQNSKAPANNFNMIEKPISSTNMYIPPVPPKPPVALKASGTSQCFPRPLPRTTKNVFYSQPDRRYIDEEKLSYYVDGRELQRQYEQAVFQEVTTEEEDGGTVKVVHFGVV